MTLGEFRKITKDFNDEIDLSLVIKTGENECVVEDLIGFAPMNVDCETADECIGLYVYGDSFLEDF